MIWAIVLEISIKRWWLKMKWLQRMKSNSIKIQIEKIKIPRFLEKKKKSFSWTNSQTNLNIIWFKLLFIIVCRFKLQVKPIRSKHYFKKQFALLSFQKEVPSCPIEVNKLLFDDIANAIKCHSTIFFGRSEHFFFLFLKIILNSKNSIVLFICFVSTIWIFYYLKWEFFLFFIFQLFYFSIFVEESFLQNSAQQYRNGQQEKFLSSVSLLHFNLFEIWFMCCWKCWCKCDSWNRPSCRFNILQWRFGECFLAL